MHIPLWTLPFLYLGLGIALAFLWGQLLEVGNDYRRMVCYRRHIRAVRRLQAEMDEFNAMAAYYLRQPYDQEKELAL